uniref:Uncharacterized protein n=1 Tax=Romanomermis culicivorax TaxID=13658 RepID=A0A915L509_ROMCU
MPKRRQHLFALAVLQFNKHLKCVHFIEKRPEDTNYVHPYSKVKNRRAFVFRNQRQSMSVGIGR